MGAHDDLSGPLFVFGAISLSAFGAGMLGIAIWQLKAKPRWQIGSIVWSAYLWVSYAALTWFKFGRSSATAHTISVLRACGRCYVAWLANEATRLSRAMSTGYVAVSSTATISAASRRLPKA
jgi:hypothetical protein